MHFSRTNVARLVTTAAAVVALSWASIASAQPNPLSVPPPSAVMQIPILKEVGLDQKLDAQVPLDLKFSDEQGREVTLGSLLGKKPVVLALVYYECPMLCTEVLNGLVSSLQTISFNAGNEFDIVAVSFDPGETPALAAQKKALYVKRYGRPGAEAGMHFLTGREDAIHALTNAVGFRYKYDPSTDQFAHTAVLTVLTPAGHVSRYLYGIEYQPRNLRLALVEAADGKIGTAVDKALLYCYHYDPETGKYGLAIMNVVRLGGIMTVAAAVSFIVLNLRRQPQARAVVRTATDKR
ncbi:MAG TPA: SCO family protein [Vicinamibacterales bacterium]|nr:SCO family protein [Vicinamibacterales bacterium]